ncbi:MAG: hypothetical protein ACKVTZ_19180 [Bacteroidia bacterium]
MKTKEKKCLLCEKEIHGRSDKKFCSISCKNDYHSQTRSEHQPFTAPIDAILHKNRAILVELMGEIDRKMFMRQDLAQKGFNFFYITGIYLNKQGKQYHYVYDFAWMEFSSQEIMVVRKK